MLSNPDFCICENVARIIDYILKRITHIKSMRARKHTSNSLDWLSCGTIESLV